MGGSTNGDSSRGRENAQSNPTVLLPLLLPLLLLRAGSGVRLLATTLERPQWR